MAWTRRLTSGRWQAGYRDAAGTKHTAGSFARKSDAVEAGQEEERRIKRNEWIPPNDRKTTVGEWFPRWFATKGEIRESSRARLESVAHTHVLPRFGDVALVAVAHADVAAWMAEMKATGLAPATRRKAFSALNQMMRFALVNRRVTFNPCEGVELPSPATAEQRFLSPAEIELLASEIEPRFRALVLLAAYGGLRFGELGGLRRKRMDVLRGRVTVAETLVEVNGELSFGEPKTKRSRRTAPLPRRIVKELDAHLARYVAPDADALVFTGPKGAPLRRAGFRRSWWKPATRAAGLDGLKVHELRHSFVALWVDAGANVKEVSVRAGHSSVAFTLDNYGHLYEDRSDQLTDRLDDLLDERKAR
jgi:integrase